MRKDVRSTTNTISTITILVNASFSRQCPKTWRRRAMIFVFTDLDCWEVIFWRKKRGKTPIFLFFVFIDPYRTRPRDGTCSLYVLRLRRRKYPQKLLRKLRRLIRGLRLEAWDSAGACEGRPRRDRRERKAPRTILELRDAKFAGGFGVISTGGGTWREHVFPVPGRVR